MSLGLKKRCIGDRGISWVKICLLLAICFVINGLAQESNAVFRVRAEKAYEAAKSAYQAAKGNDQLAWEFGRACFDWAEFAGDDDNRESLALEGIAACQAVVDRSPRLAAGYYYLAMNDGQLARTKTLGALPLVRDMEKLFKRTAELDSQFDYAGGERNLGILYLEAPGWPTSIGSRSKARAHLIKCVELSPEYPDNHLSLLEAYARWKDYKALAKAAEAYRKILPKARETLTGERWEESWLSWDKRWADIQRKLRD